MNGEDDERNTSPEWGSQRCVIGEAEKYQGRDAEGGIYHQESDDTVVGDGADRFGKIVQEIAECPEKQEDRDVQEHVNPIHEPPHLGMIKTLI
jgi:hypothetical protein